VCTVKTPDDGQRNCLKHVEYYSKNKFEKLVHLVGFIIRIYHDALSSERQIQVVYIGINVLQRIKLSVTTGNAWCSFICF